MFLIFKVKMEIFKVGLATFTFSITSYIGKQNFFNFKTEKLSFIKSRFL